MITCPIDTDATLHRAGRCRAVARPLFFGRGWSMSVLTPAALSACRIAPLLHRGPAYSPGYLGATFAVVPPLIIVVPLRGSGLFNSN